ncbi:caspase domain-containing protein [Tirmania nivea]|nr:caspase domain-containing protein [Tirmania nivea]
MSGQDHYPGSGYPGGQYSHPAGTPYYPTPQQPQYLHYVQQPGTAQIPYAQYQPQAAPIYPYPNTASPHFYNGGQVVPPGPSQSPGYTYHTPQAPPLQPQQASSGGHTYLYSQCTGKKKALLIGINYFGQRGQLRGCINDVKNMSNFLIERFGYKREDMVILTDDQQNPLSIPTRQNILQAMHWLVKGAEPNDSLFFHYSGHGGQTKDNDGDENDGYDEMIYPVDFRYNGHIVDDDMHAIMVAPLKAGVRLTAIFDSCHSGSALDLPYLYSTRGNLKETNTFRDAGEGIIDVLSHYSRGDVASVFSTGQSLLNKVTKGRGADERARRTRTSPADVIQWSGSKDTQKSADTTESGQATGAMSHAFIAALKKNPHQSYQQLLQSIREELQGKYQQRPQLSCSHPLGKEDDKMDTQT